MALCDEVVECGWLNQMSYPDGMKMVAREERAGAVGEWRLGDRAEAGAESGGGIRMSSRIGTPRQSENVQGYEG